MRKLPKQACRLTQETEQEKNNLLELPPLWIIDKVLAEKSLKHFVKQAWNLLEPSTDFVDGWHIDAIVEHLVAVTEGEILRLIINVPPRHMKSLNVCVMWPAWEWGPRHMPHTRWLTASYADSLSTRDALKTRRLIDSLWYQERWGDVFSLTSDQNQKTRYDNDKTGYRIATSVRGSSLGEGGDRIIADDPHNVLKAESDTDRETTLRWWDETMSTRINNPTKSAKIIIMQRLHHNDLTGHTISKEQDGYIHLCLPARYEKDHPFPIRSFLNVKDPRTVDGEPLWKNLYNETELKKLEKNMTEYSRAGQLQQRPSPRGGGIFKVGNFVTRDIRMPMANSVVRAVRYWDKAGTEDGGKRTAGVLMVLIKDTLKVRICHVEKGQWSAGTRENIIRQVADIDAERWPGINVATWVEQEPGSGGKESAENTIRNLGGHVVYKDKTTGNKVVRSEPYQAAVENGMVEIVPGEWAQEFLDEHEAAPVGKFKDQWDSASGAYNRLMDPPKTVIVGSWGTKRK